MPGLPMDPEFFSLARETLNAALEAFNGRDEETSEEGREAPSKRDIAAAAERVKGDAGKGAATKTAATKTAAPHAHCVRCSKAPPFPPSSDQPSDKTH